MEKNIKKNDFKKFFLLLLFLIVLFVFAIFKSKIKNSSKITKIGIFQIVEYDALDSARQGFLDEMSRLGYNNDKQSKKIEYEILNASGDIANCNSIAQKFANDDRCDLIFAISTPCAQAAANCTTTKPIIFTAVTDPVSAGLVNTLESPGRNVTGVSDLPPIRKQIELIKKINPNVKRIGVLSSDEVSSVFQRDISVNEILNLNLIPLSLIASNTDEVRQIVQKAVNDFDELYAIMDKTTSASMPSIVSILSRNKKIVVTSDSGAIKNGAAGSFTFNYYELGQKCATIVDDVLSKRKIISDIPVQFCENSEVILNDKILKEANKNYEKV